MITFKTINGRENEFVKNIEKDSYKNTVINFYHKLSLPLYKAYADDNGKAYMVDNNIGPIDRIFILYPFRKTDISLELRYVGGCLALVVVLPDPTYGISHNIIETTLMIE